METVAVPQAQWFIFHLSSDEQKRIRKLIYTATTGLSPWVYVLLSGFYGMEMIITLLRHRDVVLSAVYIVLFVAWVVYAIRYSRSRYRRLPVEGSLQLSDVGFSGTLDEEPATIHWSDIANVRDLEHVIVLFRRRNQSPVAIPKADIADVGALWAILEDRLISKRGLILSAAPRRQISNSAY